MNVRPAHEASYERVCHDTRVKSFLLPLRRAPDADVRVALRMPARPAPFLDRAQCLEFAVGKIASVLGPDFAEAHNNLGTTLTELSRHEEAIAYFSRAVELNPRYATARQWRSWFLMAMGRVQEALAEGRLAQDLDPASISVRRSLGWLQQVARRWQPAVLARLAGASGAF